MALARRVITWASVLSSLSASCLTTPVPRTKGDAALVNDGGSVDGTVDAAEDARADVDARQPLLFPPPGLTMNIRAAVVADLNQDGKVDLLVANSNGDPTTQGFFVMLGRQDGVGKYYDAYVKTGATVPCGLHVAQFGGSDALDVLVFGPRLEPSDAASEERSFVLGFNGTSPVTFDPPYTLETTRKVDPGQNGYCVIASGHFDGNDIRDVVVGDGSWVQVIMTAGWSSLALGDSAFFRLFGTTDDGWFQRATGAIGISSGERRKDDILVTDYRGASWFINDGSGNPWGFSRVVRNDAWPTVGPYFTAFHDLDKNGTPDVVGAAGTYVGAVVAGPTPDSTAGISYDQDTVGWQTGRIGGLVVDNFDANDRAEIVVIQNPRDDLPDEWQVQLIQNAYVKEQASDAGITRALASNNSRLLYVLPTDFRFGAMVRGDFNGDGKSEIVILDRSGRSLCLAPVLPDSITECTF
ncbi:MAG: hypothetical protein HY698_01385 [Deltaproteobacteria bacterium]|nr:hypothetical protein [Deltaproteobacteria bacterium]